MKALIRVLFITILRRILLWCSCWKEDNRSNLKLNPSAEASLNRMPHYKELSSFVDKVFVVNTKICKCFSKVAVMYFSPQRLYFPLYTLKLNTFWYAGSSASQPLPVTINEYITKPATQRLPLSSSVCHQVCEGEKLGQDWPFHYIKQSFSNISGIHSSLFE